MAMSASPAQGAMFWQILDSSGIKATELKAAVTASGGPHLTLDGNVSNLQIAVTCSALSLTNVNLEVFGRLTEGGKIAFSGCKVYKTSPLTGEYKCTVKSAGAATGTVESNEFKGALQLVSGNIRLKVEPLTGPTGNFATLRFEGAECVLPELNQVHGAIYLRSGFITTHEYEHLFEPDSINTAIYIGGHSAIQLSLTKVLGSAWIQLVGAHLNQKWGVLDF